MEKRRERMNEMSNKTLTEQAEWQAKLTDLQVDINKDIIDVLTHQAEQLKILNERIKMLEGREQ
jgi:hypothetical protein